MFVKTLTPVNPHFSDLSSEYLFSIIENRMAHLKTQFSKLEFINLGIGDIAQPLAPKIVSTICHAVEEMGRKETMRGYGPSSGYPFLREAICKHEYSHLQITPDEIFISDGINSDIVNIQDLFAPDSIVAITDPTYPAYLKATILSGRKNQVLQLPCTEKNGFCPTVPEKRADWVYLCSPSNPTGVAFTRNQLQAWVNWAREQGAFILYDNAYQCFISSPEVPQSIFEIEGANQVALEFRSFSKSAGFTGLRCAYVVIPKTVVGSIQEKPISLQSLWMKRQSIKFNGAPYPIQRGAEASYSTDGKKQLKQQIATYQDSAKILREGLKQLGFQVYGGVDSPYIWWKIPSSYESSWEFFDLLLEKCALICIPGKGFGENGEGYMRLSAFTTPDIATRAITAIKKL